MRKYLLTAAAALALAVTPMLAQATTATARHENSHVGTPGQAGSESGMATGPKGLSAPPSNQTSSTKSLHNTAKLPAQPGVESGGASGPSSQAASK